MKLKDIEMLMALTDSRWRDAYAILLKHFNLSADLLNIFEHPFSAYRTKESSSEVRIHFARTLSYIVWIRPSSDLSPVWQSSSNQRHLDVSDLKIESVKISLGDGFEVESLLDAASLRG